MIEISRAGISEPRSPRCSDGTRKAIPQPPRPHRVDPPPPTTTHTTLTRRGGDSRSSLVSRARRPRGRPTAHAPRVREGSVELRTRALGPCVAVRELRSPSPPSSSRATTHTSSVIVGHHHRRSSAASHVATLRRVRVRIKAARARWLRACVRPVVSRDADTQPPGLKPIEESINRSKNRPTNR